MTCQQYDADLVDLARGTQPVGEDESPVRRHLDGCAACTARFEQQRQLTAGLRALSAATAVPDNDVAERRLLNALASLQTASSSSERRPLVVRWATLAAAACLLFFVGAWAAVEWRGREAAAEQVAAETRSALRAQPALPTPIERAERPAPAPLVATNSRSSAPRVVRAALRDEPPQNTDRLAGFIPLPAAGGLPGFDSGMIVRVSIPTASLPAYGLAITPESSRTVNADLLVGQDGQARAIKLVSLVGGSRREPQ
jgi:hypothetical protein